MKGKKDLGGNNVRAAFCKDKLKWTFGGEASKPGRQHGAVEHEWKVLCFCAQIGACIYGVPAESPPHIVLTFPSGNFRKTAK